MFADRGFHGASLSAIARTAGLSNPGLIHHYPTKAKLYLAVFERLGDEFVERIELGVAKVTRPKARLRAFLAAQTAWTLACPRSVKLIQRELLDNVGRVERAKELPLTKLVSTMTREIVAAQRAGLLPVAPPLAYITQTLGALSYALIVRPTFARMEPRERMLRDLEPWLDAVMGSHSMMQNLSPEAP